MAQDKTVCGLVCILMWLIIYAYMAHLWRILWVCTGDELWRLFNVAVRKLKPVKQNAEVIEMHWAQAAEDTTSPKLLPHGTGFPLIASPHFCVERLCLEWVRRTDLWSVFLEYFTVFLLDMQATFVLSKCYGGLFPDVSWLMRTLAP